MAKQFKQLIHVLWAIEKDLHAIASSKEVSKNCGTIKDSKQVYINPSDLIGATKPWADISTIFSGMTFTGKPVSERVYREHYSEYLKRFSN